MWTAHPRTKSSALFPDMYKDKDFFLSDRFIGASWESLPVDLSQKRLCEVRCFGLNDEMSNWAPKPKFMLAEGDTYMKRPDDDTYPFLAINYVKMDKVPAVERELGSGGGRVCTTGNFFGTTGEILFHDWGIEGSGAKSVYTANIEYTFPLDFAEVVWSDGTTVDRKIVSLTDTTAFGTKTLADSVRCYREEVGAVGGLGCGGRWRLAAAGVGEVKEAGLMRSDEDDSIVSVGGESRREFLKKTGLAAAAAAGASLIPAPMFASDETPIVSIVTGRQSGPVARAGVEKIVAALKDKSVSFEEVKALDEARGRMLLVAGLASDQGLFVDSLVRVSKAVPASREALAIKKWSYKGRPVVVLVGSDDRGLMYAALDVADRIGWSNDAASPLSEVVEAVEKPGIRTRRVTLYTFQRAYWESRFYDEAYWRRYLDTLARNRFNLLHVVFGYETGGFLAPCYPYFFDVPGYPDVKMAGMTAEMQKRNMEALIG